jgi:hypothetical protein
MVNSISQRLGNAAKAAGLVAVLAGFGGCVAPGQQSNGVNMPYIVKPGFGQWNTGVGFWNLAGSAGAMNNGSGQNGVETRKLKYDNGGVYQGQVIAVGNGLFRPQGMGEMTYADEARAGVYTGEFFGGAPHGRGRYVPKNGQVLDGYWENGNFKGSQASSK